MAGLGTKMRKIGVATLVLAVLSLGVATAPAWADGIWRTSRPMETARANSAAAVVGNDIYVAGGGSVIGPRDVFEVFDTAGEIWRALPALPEPRERAAMAALGQKLYLTGGFGKDSLEPVSDLWIYDADEGNWRPGPSMPGPRGGHALVALRGKLYAIGGEGPNAPRVFVYDPAADKWTTAPWRFEDARSDIAAVTDGETFVYVLGGKAKSGDSRRTERVNVATGAWERLADMPMARSGHTAALLGQTVHVTGGASGKALKTYSEHHIFDLPTRKWRTAAPLPTPRRGLVSAAVGGKWYVIGGGSGAGFFTVFTEADVVEVYVPSGS